LPGGERELRTFEIEKGGKRVEDGRKGKRGMWGGGGWWVEKQVSGKCWVDVENM